MTKKLFRDKQNASVGGVCAGLAEYFNLDVTLVRAAFLIALFGFGTGFLLYIILWVVMPEKPFSPFAQDSATVDYTVNEEGTAEPVNSQSKPKKKERNDSVIGGLILLSLGIVFLADELVPWFSFNKMWPLILVAIGIGILWNQNKKSE
jgi:phage shock protein C